MSKFAPKQAVQLDAPKDTPITVEELALCDGIQTDRIYIAIKRTVFDVSRNVQSYGPGASYHVFAGKDASRGLAKSSLDIADAIPNYDDLSESELKVLNDWYTFFSNRYNIIGRLVDVD